MAVTINNTFPLPQIAAQVAILRRRFGLPRTLTRTYQEVVYGRTRTP